MSDFIVGSCAFKGPPTTDGTLEIAYYTLGPYEGQGHAKGMAQALISIAHSSPERLSEKWSKSPRWRAFGSAKRRHGATLSRFTPNRSAGSILIWTFQTVSEGVFSETQLY